MEENIITEENMIVIRDPQNFCFNFDCSKDIDENLKDKNEFIKKSNESLAKKRKKQGRTTTVKI